jgi:hypothetical protein
VHRPVDDGLRAVARGGCGVAGGWAGGRPGRGAPDQARPSGRRVCGRSLNLNLQRNSGELGGGWGGAPSWALEVQNSCKDASLHFCQQMQVAVGRRARLG